MKVSLRKAHQIQAEINAIINTLKIESTVKVNEFQTPETVIDNARSEILHNISRKLKFLSVLNNIRMSVSKENQKSEIFDALAGIANTTKAINLIENLVREGNVIPVTDFNVVNGRLLKMKAQEDSYQDHIMVYVFTEADKELFKTQLHNFKKTKAELQDRLIELNIKKQIELSEEDVVFLTEEKIL
jgi:hypothetical protein